MGMQDKDKDHPMVKHWAEDHLEDQFEPRASMEILEKHRSPLDHQVTEAIMIANKKVNIFLGRPLAGQDLKF